MATATTVEEESSIAVTIRTCIRAYIEDGNACSDLLEREIVPFGHFSFVSWEHSSLTLTVLLAGVCPNCQSPILRNVCVQHYATEVVAPLIEGKFPIVGRIKTLHSHDPVFDETVVAKGGTIVHPSFWTNAQPFHLCMKNFGDLHPYVQGFIKTVSEKEDNSCDGSEVPFGTMTTPQFFNKYVMCWFVTSETKVLGVNGMVLHGETEIVQGQHLFPPALSLSTSHGPSKYVVVSGDAAFFSDALYKIVTF